MNMATSYLTKRGVRMRIARARGVSHQAVNKWLKNGVPADHVIPICKMEDWLITPHELRPDIYPHPDDGLPDERRGLVAPKEWEVDG